MATEKILNTRIALKIDTLEHWNSSTIGLKEGELAIATVAATVGTGLTEPVCMIKIGEDGVKTFKDLPWNFYAKASDVLSACKSEASLKSFVNGVIADAGIASNDAMEELAGRVTKLEGDVNTEGSVAKAIKDAIDALNLDTTYVKVEDIRAERTKLAGISVGANKVEASVTNGNIKIDGIETVVYTHPNKHTIDDVAGLQDAIDDAKKAGTDAAGALDAYKGEMTIALAAKADKSVVDAMYTNTKIDELVQAAKDYADTNDADTKYGITYDSDAKKIKLVEGGTTLEIDATEFIKDGMIETVTIGDDNDLVITFNTAAGKEAIRLPLDQLVDIYTGVEGARVTVSVSSDRKVSADLVAGSISKNYLDKDVQASLGLADSAVQEEDLGTMAKEVATDYVKKSEAIGYGDILTKTEAQSAYQAKGEYYTKTEADAEFTNATEVDGQIDAKITALDLANTYQAKGAYATAEQGGKADTAIQSVTSVAGNGIKATTTGTAVTIDWDSEVILVFDCGDSGVTT